MSKTRPLDLLSFLVTTILPLLLWLAALYTLRDVLLAATQQRSMLPAWVELMSGLSRARGFGFVFGFLGILYGVQQHWLRAKLEAKLQAANPSERNGRQADREP